MPTPDPPRPSGVEMAARVFIGVVVAGLLYWAKAVFIPIALALLIAFGLNPIVRRLRRWGLPKSAAVLITTLLSAAVLAGLGWLIGGQIAGFTSQLPAYRQNIVDKITDARRSLRGGTLEKLQNTIDSVAQEVASSEKATDRAEVGPPAPGERPKPSKSLFKSRQTDEDPVPVVISSRQGWTDFPALSSLGPFLEPLSTLALVALLVFLMLLQWADLRGRLLSFLSQDVTHTTQALEDAGRRVGRFLAVQFFYNSGFGVCIGIGLWLLHVPYATLWGLCAALFRYVPYAGPVVAAALPLLVSLVTAPGWAQVAGVGALFLVMELVSNNLVEPWIYGSNLGISEIGIVVATVAWTFLWGPAGLVLATPLTVCLVVMGTHVPELRFVVRLLGDKALLSPQHRFYQRLLARDRMESAELALHHVKDYGLGSFIDDMMLPTLALARRERASGHLREATAREIVTHLNTELESAREHDAEIASSDPEAKDTPTGERGRLDPVPVAAWFACPFSDAASPVLSELLEDLPATVEIVPSRELIGASIQRLKNGDDAPAALAVIHLREEDFDRVAGMTKRIRQAWPKVPLLVVRWGGERLDADERHRLTEAGASGFAETTAETKAWLNPYIVNAAKPAAAPAPEAALVA